MTCRPDQIEAYADDELSGADRLALESHLSACEGCRRALRSARSLKAAARRVSSPAMPPELMAALQEQAALLTAPPPWRARLARFWAARPAAYGLAAGFAAAGLLLAAQLTRRATVTVSIDDLVAAHGDYARAMPLAPQDRIIAELPVERLQ